MPRYPNLSHPVWRGECPELGFRAAYVEDLSASGPGGTVECYEVGLPGCSRTLRVRGNRFFAIRFAARYWRLFVERPALRTARGLSPWPPAWSHHVRGPLAPAA